MIYTEAVATGAQFSPSRHEIDCCDRALSFAPNAVVANGDQVYWDCSRQWARSCSECLRMRVKAWHIDRSGVGSEGQRNRSQARCRTADHAGLWHRLPFDRRCSSCQDDHDYFDNDEATDEVVTSSVLFHAPARACHAGDVLPEFCPTLPGPLGLPWSSTGDQAYRKALAR